MDMKTIKRIAEECHIDLFPPIKLVNIGNGISKFIKPTEISYYGKKIIKFANLIEQEVIRMKKAE